MINRALLAGIVTLLVAPFAACGSDSPAATLDAGAPPALPVNEIEQIVGAQGHLTRNVLTIEIERTDIGNVRGPDGVTLTPSFGIHGDLYFQLLGTGQALLNGDLALKEAEVDPFITALIQQGLVFQAFHQHVPTTPQVWFVHFRGVGDPIALAHEIRAAMDVTGTPLPQPAPQNAQTPLDTARLASILHGDVEVGDEGVVTVTVDRTDAVTLGGVRVDPAAGISTVIEFKPLTGTTAAVIPDFSMTASEVQPVVDHMLVGLQWTQGCLYNQETAEQPQLYFDHMVKSGDAYQLATEIRAGLDLTRAK